jgi:hypothetical protein
MDLRGCPESRCPVVAEVVDRTVLESTDGPVEHVRIECVRGHTFFCPAFVLEAA